jgi:hypothetical protein
MRPRERQETGEQDLFRSRLDRIIDLDRVAGEIALQSPEPGGTKAEAYFERALTVARQQQAKSWELRAAMSLARLWRDQGKVQQARELLAPVYGWFAEGFDTRDLKEAKALLDELHHGLAFDRLLAKFGVSRSDDWEMLIDAFTRMADDFSGRYKEVFAEHERQYRMALGIECGPVASRFQSLHWSFNIVSYCKNTPKKRPFATEDHCEVRQDRLVYFVFAECRLVLPEAQAAQPDHDIHSSRPQSVAVGTSWFA